MDTIGHPLRPEDPASISDYQLLGRLGGGGMGIVYAARSPRGQVVALKTARALDRAEPEDVARFGREMRAASSVDSPHVAAVLGFRRDVSPPFLVTELVDGLDVRENVAGHGPLGEDDCVALAVGTARGLAALHDRDIAHRDLTWSNVVLTAAGPVIVDLGIAVRRDDTGPDAALIGSPGWMPPEALATGPSTSRRDPRAGDVFQWGLLVAHAATARHPFGPPGAGLDGLQQAIVDDAPRELGEVPARLRWLVDRALSHDPTARPTAAELVTVLERSGAPDDDVARLTPSSDDGPSVGAATDSTATRVVARGVGADVVGRTRSLPSPRPPDATDATGAPTGAATDMRPASADGREPESVPLAWTTVEFRLGPGRTAVPRAWPAGRGDQSDDARADGR